MASAASQSGPTVAQKQAEHCLGNLIAIWNPSTHSAFDQLAWGPLQLGLNIMVCSCGGPCKDRPRWADDIDVRSAGLGTLGRL